MPIFRPLATLAVLFPCGLMAATPVFAPGGGTYFGGSQWDRAQSVHVDAAGFIYLCGSTRSQDAPVTGGAFDTTHNGYAPSKNAGHDGYVAKLSPDGSRILWCTLLGGKDRDDLYGVTTDAAGAVYVVGWTASSDFPVTAGAYDRTFNGKPDIVIAKLTPDGSRLVYATYVGGNGTDQCRGAVAVDAAGRVVFAGYTDSRNYPVTSGAIQGAYRGGYGDACIGMLSADGSSLLYASFLGSSGPDNAFAGIKLHSDGTWYVGGLAGAADFPTTSGAAQSTFGGSPGGNPWYGDGFITRIAVDGQYRGSLVFSTFIGGSGNDMPMAQHAFTIDAAGNGHLFASTNSPDYPVTPGALQATLQGGHGLALTRLAADGSRFLASTYLGRGTGYEPSGIAVGPDGRVYVSGTVNTATAVHPLTPDALPGQGFGNGDGFFSVLRPDFGSLVYSTIVGGQDDDRIRDLSRGADGRIALAMDTYSDDLPIPPGAAQPARAGNDDGALMVLRPAPVPVNTPPAVEAGTDTSVVLGEDLHLAGSVSDDGLPNGTLAVQWSTAAGPAAAIFADPAAAVTTVSFPLAGTYLLNLSASDGALAATDQVLVTVAGRQDPVPTDAGGHWPLDDLGGTVAIDASGGGSHGSLVNGPRWISGHLGGALAFDGTNDHVRVANEATFDLNGSMSVALWLRRSHTQARNERLVNKPTAAFYKPTFAFQFANDGSLGANFFATNGTWADLSSSAAITDTDWHHACLVLDLANDSGRIHVDGVEVARGSFGGRVPRNGNGPLFIGAGDATHEHFSGAIDDVRFFHRALSSEEIAALAAMAPPALGAIPGIGPALVRLER